MRPEFQPSRNQIMKEVSRIIIVIRYDRIFYFGISDLDAECTPSPCQPAQPLTSQLCCEWSTFSQLFLHVQGEGHCSNILHYRKLQLKRTKTTRVLPPNRHHLAIRHWILTFILLWPVGFVDFIKFSFYFLWISQNPVFVEFVKL